MEATIRIDDNKTFESLVQFLKSLNIDVKTNEMRKSTRLRSENAKKDVSEFLPKNNMLSKLVGMYNSGISRGSINHDKELYNE